MLCTLCWTLLRSTFGCRDDSKQQPAWSGQGQPLSLLVKQQWAHLLRAVASLHEGRDYLSTASEAVLQQLCAWLQADSMQAPSGQDSVRPSCQHLACVQYSCAVD